MKYLAANNKYLLLYIESRSIEWLEEEAINLKSLRDNADDEKRRCWLAFTKRWVTISLDSFIYNCDCFDKSILYS